MDTQQLLHSNPEPKRLWFARKRYGWGWTPSTWEGWVITLLYIAAVIANAVFMEHITPISTTAWVLFFMHIATLTTFLILICYARGESPKWQWGGKRELMIDVLDKDGKPTGKISSRSDVHEKGLWHKAAHVYIVNSSGEVLLQRRSAQHSIRAGRWYLSTGAHVPAGCTSLDTAKDCTKSELGLPLTDADFEFVGTISKENVLLYGTYINNEFDDMYVVRNDTPIASLNKNSGEVGDIEWFKIEKFKEYAEGNDPSFVRYGGLPLLFDYLEKHPRKA